MAQTRQTGRIFCLVFAFVVFVGGESIAQTAKKEELQYMWVAPDSVFGGGMVVICFCLTRARRASTFCLDRFSASGSGRDALLASGDSDVAFAPRRDVVSSSRSSGARGRAPEYRLFFI